MRCVKKHTRFALGAVSELSERTRMGVRLSLADRTLYMRVIHTMTHLDTRDQNWHARVRMRGLVKRVK